MEVNAESKLKNGEYFERDDKTQIKIKQEYFEKDDKTSVKKENEEYYERDDKTLIKNGEEDFEEDEDLEREEHGDGESDDSAASGATTPLTREIRSYEERNQELLRRLREFEEERRHQNDIKEKKWKGLKEMEQR